LGVEVSAKGLVGNGQLILSMGLKWRNLHPGAKGLPLQVRNFFVLITTDVLIVPYICCQYAFCAIHIFFLSRLKIKLFENLRADTFDSSNIF
jgi:hypothetical protein